MEEGGRRVIRAKEIAESIGLSLILLALMMEEAKSQGMRALSRRWKGKTTYELSPEPPEGTDLPTS